METGAQQVGTSLSAEELRKVEALAKRIDPTDTNLVVGFGAGPQRTVARCAARVLAVAQDPALDKAVVLVSETADELRAFSAGGRGPLGRLRGRMEGPAALRGRCTKVATRVDESARALRAAQRALMKDAALLDQLHAAIQECMRDLELYLAAGRQALNAAPVRDGVTNPQAATACERFERKLHDLDLSRMVALQTGSQIRVLQRSQQILVDKIQDTLSTTIPLWRNQTALALGLARVQAVRDAHEAFDAASDDALRAHADDLRREAVALADALAGVARAQAEDRTCKEDARAAIERLQLPPAPPA